VWCGDWFVGLGFCCDLDPIDGCCLLWVGYDLLVLVVSICCGLVVVGALDCCGLPVRGVVFVGVGVSGVVWFAPWFGVVWKTNIIKNKFFCFTLTRSIVK
jgi:hypothetical protein